MKSLHFKLFRQYAPLILSIIIVFMIIVYFIWGNTLKDNAKSELLTDCDNISSLLDIQIEQMNDLSKRIVDSRQIQALFIKDLYSSEPEAYNNRHTFSNELFDIIRLSFDHMELTMLDTSGRYIHVGMSSTFENRGAEAFADNPWITPILDAYGKKIILPTHYPALNETDMPVLSLCRAFAPLNPSKQTAILELQLQYSYINEKIANALHNRAGKEICIYDQAGNLIYPYTEPESSQLPGYVSDFFQNRENRNSFDTFSSVGQYETMLYAQKTSSATGFTVFVAMSEKDLFSSFYQFRTIIFLVTILILVLTILITNHISLKLSAPIKELEKNARLLTLDNLDTIKFQPPPGSFQELVSLYGSFEQMKKNLQDSLQDAVLARTATVDAQILALQAQMNPHFLYNTLASISILAEDGEDEAVIHVCDDLSAMLRYISSSSVNNVTIDQEIDHTRSYINLMKVKYESFIQFHLEIDPSMADILVPKLIVQPLVENCIKYGLDVDPPWIITIRGFLEHSSWIIQVRDNGTGFTGEYLDSFQAEMEALNLQSSIPALHINGMGLLNLYIRLYLLYEDRMIFKLENHKDGGACVTVGGPLPEKYMR